MGFEPTEPCGSTVFKTAPFDRSGTPPRAGQSKRLRRARGVIDAGRVERRLAVPVLERAEQLRLRECRREVDGDEPAREPLGHLALEGDVAAPRPHGTRGACRARPAVPRSSASARRPRGRRSIPRATTRTGSRPHTARSRVYPSWGTRQPLPSDRCHLALHRADRAGTAGRRRLVERNLSTRLRLRSRRSAWPRRPAEAGAPARSRACAGRGLRAAAWSVPWPSRGRPARGDSRAAPRSPASSSSASMRCARTAMRKKSRISWRPSKFGVTSIASRNARSSARVHWTRTVAAGRMSTVSSVSALRALPVGTGFS